MSNAFNNSWQRAVFGRALPGARFVVALFAVPVFVGVVSPSVARAAFGGWEFQPYRIHARLAIDVQGGLAEKLAAELPVYLKNRVETSFAPTWVFNVELVTGAAGANVIQEIETATPEKPGDLPKDTDKLIVLAIRSTPLELQLAAREYDRYVERWSVPISRECRQVSSLPEQMFALMWHTFSPLAQVDPDPNDPKRAMLWPRGSGLPHSDGIPPWAKVGDVFLPIVRRTARGGQVVENGIQAVPWTYIEAIEAKAPAEDKQKDKGNTGNNKDKEKDKEKPKVNEKLVPKSGSTLDFQVHSGSRRPFVGRKSNRLEQLAIGVRADAAPTTLRFHARKNEKKPLIGYEALVQKPGAEEPTRIGLSDPAGNVVIQPSNERVQLLIVKHGGQLLAKLPIVPGAESLVKVPLPDDDARLAAEARLAALREDLIDVVARRNILMARARKRIENKDYAGAQELLRTLDELPGKSQFKLALDTSARLLRSDDPSMQRKIDGLFSQTQTLMNQFLDIKPISQINNELREAQQKSPAPAGKRS